MSKTSNICPGEAITVSYTTSGTFASGNTFRVQLSDAAGSFIPPVNISAPVSATSGNVSATIPSDASTGYNYQIRIVSTNPSNFSVIISTNKAVTINKSAAPAAPKVTTPPPYCKGSPATPLSATATQADGVLKWYTAIGAPLSSAPTPNTDVTKTTATTYLVSQNVSGCEGPSATVTATVYVVDPPGVTSLTYCQGKTADPLNATAANGATLNWFTKQPDGTIVKNTVSSPKPSTTIVGPTSYSVSQTVGVCESSTAVLTVTITDIPVPPSVTGPLTTCYGSTITVADFGASSTYPNGILHWWKGSNKVDPGPSTPSNTDSNTYYVSQEVKGCDGLTAAIPVTIINPPSSAPVLKGPAPVCAGSSVSSLTATTTSTDYQLRWYSSPNSSTYTITTPAVNSSATTAYYARQATKEGCTSALASVTVTVNSLPAAPSAPVPDAFCLNRTTDRTLVANGANLKWYDANNTLLSGAPSPPVDKTGDIVYYVSQTDANGCTSATRTKITATVNAIPGPPAATVPQDYCAGETAQPLSATGVSLRWYGIDSTSSPTASSTPATSTAFIGTKNYYVTQTVNGCASNTRAIPVRVKETPGLPTVQDNSFCQNATPVKVTATAANGATLNWWGENASGGTRSNDAPAVPNTVDKTYTYYVSQTLNGCESGLGSSSGRAKINIRVKATPTAPTVGSVSLCNNSSASQLAASGSNLKWYDSSDKLLGSTLTPSTNAVGDQTYKVSQTSSEGCESTKSSLTVTIKPLPDPPGVNNVAYCQIQQDQPTQTVSALSANGQNLRWFSATNTALSNAPTPSITQTGDQTYKVSQTVNGCEGGQATVKVSVNTSAAPTVPKSLVTYCLNDNATALVATGDNGGQLRWLDPYSRLTNDAPTPSTLNTNIMPGGDAFYVYQIGANGCYSARSTIRVVVTTPPTLALVAPTTSVNLGQRTALQLKFTSVGPYSYTLTGGYTGTSQSADTTISVLPRGNTIYQIVNVLNGCGVGLPGNPATAQVTVRVPTISTSSITNATLCTGTTLTAPFTTTGNFNSGNTFRMELVSAADTTKKYDVLAKASGSPVTATLPTTVPSGQYYVRVKADNPEIAITGSNSPTPLMVRSVASATLTGSQTIYEGVPASLTLTFTGDGPWTTTYADSLRTYTATTASNPYVIDARPSKTTTYRLVSVTNSCGNGPVSGVATITVSPLLAVDDDPLSPLVKTYPIPTTTVLKIELNLPLAREPATLLLTDANGRTVSQQTTRSQMNELDLTTQSNGLYFLRIQVGDRQTVRKVVKQ